jgi:hypothetical protein
MSSLVFERVDEPGDNRTRVLTDISDFTRCCEECNFADGCEAFSFTKTGGVCLFFYDTDAVLLQVNDSFTSGVVITDSSTSSVVFICVAILGLCFITWFGKSQS